jgi:hypothetical protein
VIRAWLAYISSTSPQPLCFIGLTQSHKLHNLECMFFFVKGGCDSYFQIQFLTVNVREPILLLRFSSKFRVEVGLIHGGSQGVLLLNAVLTVRDHQPNSHARKGWERFTDAAIRTVSQQRSGIVFVLWGNAAQEKMRLINTNVHHILKAAHPSGLSANRGFFGCRYMVSFPCSSFDSVLTTMTDACKRVSQKMLLHSIERDKIIICNHEHLQYTQKKLRD